MRKKERLWRHAVALLAAVCMLNTMPCTSITVNANENIINIGTEEKEIPEQAEDDDTRQADTEEDTGQTEKTEEADVGQTEESEGPETDDAGQAEDTEETEKPEETDLPGDAVSGKEDFGTEEAEDIEIEDPGLEGAEQAEETETEQIEAEGSMLLLSEEQEGVEGTGEEDVTDASYTDENGVVYHYHGHEDGTADLYEITEYSGKDINIPAYIDGYAVTQLTFHIWGMIPAVTIPETVTYIGAIAFVDSNIGTLYYNATEEVKVEPMPDAPFRHVKIGNLITGENVHILPADMFAFAEFQEDITITVETVGEEAFKYAIFPSLNLTGQVKEIRERAFIGAKIQTLRYDTEAVHTAGTTTEGMFWGASIQELAIGENIAQLPDYVFCRADLCFDEYTVNVERIGDHAFDMAWGSAEKGCERLVLSDRVKYIGAGAFANDYITTLDLQASAESGATCQYDGCFYRTHITELCIGENVSVIPEYMFCNSYITVAPHFL